MSDLAQALQENIEALMDRKQEFLGLVLEAEETGDRTKLAEWWRKHFPGYKMWLVRPGFTLVLPDDGRVKP